MDNENAKLQLLLDRAEISDVQLRYATGLDSRDWPLFRSCFINENEIETDFTNDTGDSTQTMFGYYTNRFIRTSSGWKIRARKLTLTWQTGNWGIFTLASARFKAAEASNKS